VYWKGGKAERDEQRSIVRTPESPADAGLSLYKSPVYRASADRPSSGEDGAIKRKAAKRNLAAFSRKVCTWSWSWPRAGKLSDIHWSVSARRSTSSAASCSLISLRRIGDETEAFSGVRGWFAT
jgi:hypothetical protein